jgi:hypothetical protein
MAHKDAKEQKHYVNNPEFLKEMKVHIAAVKRAKKDKKPMPQVSNYIGECIVSIANKLANKPNFVNYPFREEMISDGIENSLQYLNNFNPKKSSNPFAYFTQIIYFAFVRRIQKEKKHLATKYRMIEESLSELSGDSDGINSNGKYGSDYADANMHEFLQNFEKMQEEKKRKIKDNKKNAKDSKTAKKSGFEKIIDNIK